MTDKNIEVLEEVLDVLEEEKRKFYNLINQNDFRIEEINSYLRELSKNEEDNFRVFSPRNAENKHRQQIDADILEKKKCEKENEEYNRKVESLKVLIGKVNTVIGNLQFAEDEKRQLMEKNNDETSNAEKNNFIENMKQEVSKIEEQTPDSNYENMLTVKKENSLDRMHIAHQILNCVSFIALDAERAKIELTALSVKLQNNNTCLQ